MPMDKTIVWTIVVLAAVCQPTAPAQAQVPCRNVHTCQQAYDRCVDVRTRNNIPKNSLTCEASIAACRTNGVWRGTSMGAGTRMIECKVSAR